MGTGAIHDLAIALRFWILSRALCCYAVLLLTRSPQPAGICRGVLLYEGVRMRWYIWSVLINLAPA